MKEFRNLKRIAQEELEELDKKYADKHEFTAADAEMYKCLTMALEKQLRIEQIESEMHGEEWPDNENMMSGRRNMSYGPQHYMGRDYGPGPNYWPRW